MDPRIAALSGHLAAMRPPFCFEPPLDDVDLAAAEQRLGVTLPDSFRAFLAQVSRGHAEHPLLDPRLASAGDAHLDRPFEPDAFPADGALLVWDDGGGVERYVILCGDQRGSVWCHHEGGWTREPPASPNGDVLDWMAWWLTVW